MVNKESNKVEKVNLEIKEEVVESRVEERSSSFVGKILRVSDIIEDFIITIEKKIGENLSSYNIPNWFIVMILFVFSVIPVIIYVTGVWGKN